MLRELGLVDGGRLDRFMGAYFEGRNQLWSSAWVALSTEAWLRARYAMSLTSVDGGPCMVALADTLLGRSQAVGDHALRLGDVGDLVRGSLARRRLSDGPMTSVCRRR